MKNLENFGVQELGTEEFEGINGGFWPTIGKILEVLAVGAAIDYAAEQFLEGWNNPK